jgi:protoporphyrinogen oxidase
MKVAVVGAGITGLTLGHQLLKGGISVDIFEKEDSPGGLAANFSIGGGDVEKFYHHIFLNDHEIIGLLDELGLKERLFWRNASSGVFYKGSIYPFDSPLDLLRFKPLSPADRLRLGLGFLKVRRIQDWESIQGVRAKDFIVQNMGLNPYDIVWKPLFISKFGDEYENISAAWFWAKMKSRGRSRGRNQRELLGYLRGGFGVMASELEAAIEARGGTMFNGTPVEEIRVENGRVKGLSAGGKSYDYDGVVFTAALPILLKMAKDLPDEYAKELSAVRYQSAICLVLKLTRSLSDTYWLNISDTSFPFVVVVEHTNFERSESYGGFHIAYVSRYLNGRSSLYSLDREELFREFVPYLKRVYPDFDERWVVETYLHKGDFAQPVITTDYARLVPDARTPVKNLWLSTMAQVYPEDRGMNYAVRIAKRVGEMVMQDVKNSL